MLEITTLDISFGSYLIKVFFYIIHVEIIEKCITKNVIYFYFVSTEQILLKKIIVRNIKKIKWNIAEDSRWRVDFGRIWNEIKTDATWEGRSFFLSLVINFLWLLMLGYNDVKIRSKPKAESRVCINNMRG